MGVLTVADSRLNSNNRRTTVDEQFLYTHLLTHVATESPSELIKNFRSLFIDGVGYPHPQVCQALENIVNSHFAEVEFKFIINRSCYILINRWLEQPLFRGAIPELIALFESLPTGLAPSPTAQRLLRLVQAFTQTEQYIKLRNLAQAIRQKTGGNGYAGAQPLKTLIRRYPCLYEHCFIRDDSTDEERKKVKLARARVQRQFQINLSQYITYQQLELSRNSAVSQVSQQLGQNMPNNWRTRKNPTLLSNDQLDTALQYFTGKVDSSNTYRDLAQQFITYSRWTPSYQTFKEELYEYLIASIDTKYGACKFNQLLHQQLQNTFSQNDHQKLNDALLEGTCKRLLSFLVVESVEQPTHYIFSDLTGNLGITPTIGLLMRIVLLCSSVRPYLEKRFSILFNHYQAYARDSVEWLVEALENLNVALVTNCEPNNFS
ncbi:hypothetical protein [Lyngbya aestuarii]|uniref:hypothetical protein n=1 Tax=Lyngbya aestuarii TaxID=118322 RepID=UPI00403DDF78